MKKLFLFFTFAALILLAGCQATDDNEVVINHHIDIATMQGDEIPDVSPSSEIIIDNLDLKYGYYLSTSMTKGTGNSKNENENIYKTMGGDYLAIPNSDKKIYLHGSDIGIHNKTSAFIRKYENIDDDLTISKDENPINKNLIIGLTDEFYYVDFADRTDLDPSKVAVVYSQQGVIGDFKLIQYGMTNKLQYSVFDLSGFPGFGLYSYISKNWTSTETDWNTILHVTSPVSIQSNPVVSRSVNDGAAVIDVDLPAGQYYTIEAEYSTQDELYCLIRDLHSRYYNGEARDEIMIPVVTENKVTYYTGLVDKPFVFTVNLSVFDEENVDEIQFSYTTSTQADFPGFFDIANLKAQGIEIRSDSASRYLTFAYRMSEAGTYPFTSGVTQGGNTIYAMESISRGKHSSGSGMGFSGRSDDTSMTGYIIWDCNSLPDNTLLGTLACKETAYITCSHIKWNPVTKLYECQDDGCGKSYAYGDMFTYERNSSLDRNLQVDLGKLGTAYVTNCGGLTFKNVPDLSFNTGGNADGEEGEFAHLSHGDDIDDYVYVALKEAWFDSDNMVSKAIFTIKVHFKDWNTPGPEVYNNIVANYVHLHKWDFSDLSIAVCSCGEERPYTSGWVEPGYNNAVISGLRGNDTITVAEPLTEYAVELSNGSYTFPILPGRTVIYFVSPSADCNLTLSGQGNDYKIKATY